MMGRLFFEDESHGGLMTAGNSGRGAVMFAFALDDGTPALLEIEADRIIRAAAGIKRGGRFRHFHEDVPSWAADVL